MKLKAGLLNSLLLTSFSFTFWSYFVYLVFLSVRERQEALLIEKTIELEKRSIKEFPN